MDRDAEFLRQMGTARDARDRAEALAAVREGRGRIFFKHMRKAGGTTVIRYFEHVVAFKSYVPLPGPRAATRRSRARCGGRR